MTSGTLTTSLPISPSMLQRSMSLAPNATSDVAFNDVTTQQRRPRRAAGERLVAALALAGVPETSGPMREGDPSGVGGEGVPEMSGTKHSDDPGGDPVCSSSNYTIHVREDISGKVPGEDPETQAGRGFPGDDTPEKGCTPSPATVVDDPFLSALLGGKGADRSALIPVLDDMLGRRARPDDDDPDPAWVEGSL